MTSASGQDLLMDRLFAVPGTCSVTIVGSWVDAGSSATPGDLDVVVIADRLTPEYFRAATCAAGALTAGDLGFPGRRLLINDTLGPLKFDEADLAVLHLMLYDRDGHREHALRSSFTCYDWERSSRYRGISLARAYPVLKLQPRDFTASRRGLRDYLADLARGGVSFRRYVPDGERMVQRTEWRPMEGRQCAEFSYHVIRNLIANYVKLATQSNSFFPPAKLDEAWTEHLPELACFQPDLARLRRAKLQRESVRDINPVELAREFVSSFESHFQRDWGTARRIVFTRHAPTDLNTGEFLGSRRDPPVKPGVPIPVLDFSPETVFSSPLLRARQTAAALAPGKSLRLDSRLSEIDYGSAEGLNLEQLRVRNPEILSAWRQGEDPSFPGGENTAAVQARLNAFLADLMQGHGNALVVTHNVVLRCLAGQLLGIPPADWHRLSIPPLTRIDLVCRSGRWYPDMDQSVKATLIDGLLRSRE